MSRIHVMIGLAFASATAADVHAQRLLQVEGIELRGTARVVEYGGATCNVVEDSEAPAAYERKKASHGQPLDIWQLDFSVYNGSGRPLDHLIANYRIAAEQPPCTNWDFRDYERYPGPIEWGSLAGFIQRSGSGNPTAPRETLTDTRYVFVFHDHQPRFDTWQVDYDFAAGAVAAPLPIPAPVPVDIASPVDRPDNTGAQPDPVTPTAPAAVSLAPPTETCAGQRVGSACWMELSNRPGCYVWNGRLVAGEAATWSGQCSGGYAQGVGTVLWRHDNGGHTWEGTYVDGKRNGHWVIRYADEDVVEGSYVDGERNGDWIMRSSSGSVTEMSYVNDELHGDVISVTDEAASRRVYTNGKRHGDSVIWRRNGEVEQISYVNGKFHGLNIVCQLGERANVKYVAVYEHGERELFHLYDTIEDQQLARTAAATCARLLAMERPSLSRNR